MQSGSLALPPAPRSLQDGPTATTGRLLFMTTNDRGLESTRSRESSEPRSRCKMLLIPPSCGAAVLITRLGMTGLASDLHFVLHPCFRPMHRLSRLMVLGSHFQELEFKAAVPDQIQRLFTRSPGGRSELNVTSLGTWNRGPTGHRPRFYADFGGSTSALLLTRMLLIDS